MTQTRIWGLLLGLLLAVPALAQPTKYDLAEFIIPDGFTARQGDGQLELTYIDQPRGFSLQVGVYPTRVSLGSPAQDFASEWQQTVAASFPADAVPGPVPSKMPASAPLFEGGSTASSSSGSAWVHLYVFEFGGKILTVMVVASNRGAFDTMQPTLTQFFQSLRLPSAPAVAALSPAPAALTARPKRGNAKWSGAPIVGIWMGFKDVGEIELNAVFGTFDVYVSKHKLRWRTFLCNGSSFEGLPRNGLLSLEIAEARAEKDDGLKLEGTWSSWMKWDDRQAAPNWTSAPVISLTRDGHFVDRGALMYSTIDPLTAQNAQRHPGKGTYEINGYTLGLRYDDGREVHRPFIGAMKKDPSRDASVVFIGQFPLYRP